MRLPFLAFAVLALILLAGCGSKAPRDPAPTGYGSPRLQRAAAVSGDFASVSGVDRFIRRMEPHGFSPAETARIISGAQRQQSIIDLMNRQAPSKSTGPNGAWSRYRAKFLTEDTIANGAAFWRRHESALARAESRYGVPPEYVVAIIGVETRFGGFVGKTRIIDALATLAFAYPRRADYFAGELESFLIMTRDEGISPFQPRGSFAGAMGLGQFMPSSFHQYAVDFTGDGHRDLWNPEDAIGSVANYFKGHGWRAGEPVAARARVESGARAGLMKTGFDTRYGVKDLAGRGIVPTGSLGGAGQVSLLQLDAKGGYEYWLGLPNFYVITRYNHSTYYAMAVHQLAQAIRARKVGAGGVRLSAN
ncbi:lytic murein transglycosylase B [Thiocystis minor]|uniref:lytic murein transglycosylase B n=1 Tax=Thiocystis minor TaxID=61597 RepID=UPI001912B75E|nr:lytic murein transglycosylase B [Thiocystis minor]MBK5965780.1 lytic murein transglycosylase B [Thiocystis minor]